MQAFAEAVVSSGVEVEDLKFLVRIRLLKESDIVDGKVTVGQFIGRPATTWTKAN